MDEEVEDFYEEATSGEIESLEEAVVDRATAAQTIREVELEIASLQELVTQSARLLASGVDRKWVELSRLLQDAPEMQDAEGRRRKLILFTEHKDTLSTTCGSVSRGLLGRTEALVTIHGGVRRQERRKAQELFTNDPDTVLLLATDAAGEGVNLQRANLMVNYDLPWNPNRLEQRFGRIHRIGQTEVCHLWNLVAHETREGAVFQRLFEKLESERATLGGKVFDILGQVFEQRSLKDLLLEAIQYGNRPEVRARLCEVVDEALDVGHLQDILNRNALASESLNAARVFRIREEMEQAEARKLQPFFIQSFFAEAFRQFGGELKPREPQRFEIHHVPSRIRNHDAKLGSGAPVLRRYERVCFEKTRLRVEGRSPAVLLTPAHPLLTATLDLVLEQHRPLLRQGTLLIDRADEGTEPRMLFLITHTVNEGHPDSAGRERVLSQQMLFVSVARSGQVALGGQAPYLDCDPPRSSEQSRLAPLLEADWLRQDLEAVALRHVVEHLVPEHHQGVAAQRQQWVQQARQAVEERLVKEINHWVHRYEELKLDVAAGRQPCMQPENARRRAEDLSERLERRMAELKRQEQVFSQTPVVVGRFADRAAGLAGPTAGAARSAMGGQCRSPSAHRAAGDVRGAGTRTPPR